MTKEKKLQHKFRDLKKHYPDNVYELNEHNQIIRISGRNPHKIKVKK